MKSPAKPVAKARGLMPYASQLLNDQDVQENMLRGVRSARDAYARARGKDAVEVVQDKKLQRRLRETARAAVQVWSGVSEPPPKPKVRRAPKLAWLAVAGGGVFLAVNPQARAKVLGLLGRDGSSSTQSPEEPRGDNDVR